MVDFDVGDAAPDADDQTADEEPEQMASDRSTETEPATESEPDVPDDSASRPPFEYSAVRQRPLYARAETWGEFEDAVGITVVPALRKAGIRNEETREIHDAVLRLAAEEPERVAELIEAERSV